MMHLTSANLELMKIVTLRLHQHAGARFRLNELQEPQNTKQFNTKKKRVVPHLLKTCLPLVLSAYYILMMMCSLATTRISYP